MSEVTSNQFKSGGFSFSVQTQSERRAQNYEEAEAGLLTW